MLLLESDYHELSVAWLDSCILPDTSGWSKSNRDLGCLPNNNSAGERLVVVCGVTLYCGTLGFFTQTHQVTAP